jgi:hypothetical protein
MQFQLDHWMDWVILSKLSSLNFHFDHHTSSGGLEMPDQLL